MPEIEGSGAKGGRRVMAYFPDLPEIEQPEHEWRARLDAYIAQGWGDTPRVAIPDNWRDYRGPDNGYHKTGEFTRVNRHGEWKPRPENWQPKQHRIGHRDGDYPGKPGRKLSGCQHHGWQDWHVAPCGKGYCRICGPKRKALEYQRRIGKGARTT